MKTRRFSSLELLARPSRATVAQRCAQIAASEGLQVEPNALEALAESCGSDMRMAGEPLEEPKAREAKSW